MSMLGSALYCGCNQVDSGAGRQRKQAVTTRHDPRGLLLRVVTSLTGQHSSVCSAQLKCQRLLQTPTRSTSAIIDVTRLNDRATKCHFGHSELLMPPESAIKEL